MKPFSLEEYLKNPSRKVVTREFLLANEFDFRIWYGSQMPEGEYTLRGKGWIIRIGWSRMFAWDLEVINFDERINIKADSQDNISIEQLHKILDVAKIELKLIEK